MEAVLNGTSCVHVYLDGIIVAEKAEDYSVLMQLLQCLQKPGLWLNQDKCRFRQEKVTCLGHSIDKRGLRPNEDSVATVFNAPKPRLVSELKAFLVLLRQISASNVHHVGTLVWVTSPKTRSGNRKTTWNKPFGSKDNIKKGNISYTLWSK